MKKIKIEITVNRQHQEIVEDDDYFINNIEVDGKEVQSLEDLEVEDLPCLSVEDAVTADELAELDSMEYETEDGIYQIIVTDLDEDILEEDEEEEDF